MKKKLAVMCTLACLVFNNITPVMAKGYSSPTDNANVPISYDMESIFTVTLPKGINGGKNSSVDFDYSVEGNIASNEVVTVKPLSNTFTLSDVKGKTLDANISMPKTTFGYNEISTKNIQTGTVSVNNLPAGRWDGISKFLINLDSLEPGLYDTEGNFLCEITAEQLSASYGYRGSTLPSSLGLKPSDIAKVIIPNGITTVGSYAFDGCTNLTSVIIPSTVTAFGSHVFYGCSKLQSIVLPDGITSISDSLFNGCSSLSSVNIPDGVTYIGSAAFNGCRSLSSLSFPNSLKTIARYAFSGCSGLSTIELPETLTNINEGAFQNCTGLTSFKVPSGVSYIDSYTFNECTNLSNLMIPDTVTTIERYALINVKHAYYSGSATGSPWGAKAVN